jgi:ubiquinone/menaquinone biosynthesis C-methylase UbiE
MAFIRASKLPSTDPIIDVGGGSSLLVDELLRQGYTDLTVLDISGTALQTVRSRLGEHPTGVQLLQADVRSFEPTRRYALRHDRAVFHFLVEAVDRKRYIAALQRGLREDGQVVIATFGPQGSEKCSGLPVRRYDSTTLAGELGNEFALTDSALVLHRTPSGAEQQLLYCRFQRHS